MRSTFGKTVTELAKKDKKIVVLVGDISHGLFGDLRKTANERYFNIGINEQSMINIAAGLSMQGFNPVVHTIAPFLIDRNFEQLKLDFSYQNQNINLVSIGGAFDYSKLGCTHHSYSDLSLIMHLDNSKVFIPGSKDEFSKIFKKNYKTEGIKYYKIFNKTHSFKELKNGSVFKKGNSITIVCMGSQLDNVIKSVKKLNIEKIFPEIIYYNTLKPFKNDVLIKSLNKTEKLLVVEEISSQDGLLNLCLKTINKLKKKKLNYDVISISKFIKGYGDYESLSKKNGFSVNNIFKKSKKLFNAR